MRYYESLYIVNPNFEQERLNDLMNEVAGKVTGYGFKIINHRVWGKKRLAYTIQKHKYGIFILLQFETENLARMADFERFMVLNKAILRNQTVRLESQPEVFDDSEATVKKVSVEDSQAPKVEPGDDLKADEEREEVTTEENDNKSEENPTNEAIDVKESEEILKEVDQE
ncbi:MAG: 30S ribosomal protein S6 [Fidelibacterota bacterium]